MQFDDHVKLLIHLHFPQKVRRPCAAFCISNSKLPPQGGSPHIKAHWFLGYPFMGGWPTHETLQVPHSCSLIAWVCIHAKARTMRAWLAWTGPLPFLLQNKLAHEYCSSGSSQFWSLARYHERSGG